MVQGIMELIFDAAYLIFAMTIGIYLIVKGKSKFTKMFGVMAVVLSSGDSFHLVPRVYALLTTGLEANAFALGLGKLITSVTMTVFYVILYFILESVWQPDKKLKTAFRAGLLVMTAARIALCAFPQNDWFSYEGSLLWGILRNIPFAVIGDLEKISIRSNGDLCYLIWQNIISNAVKYSEPDSKISIKLCRQSDYLLFSVTNKGESLKGKEDIIFEPFYTTDRSGTEKGTGLGLPLVKKTVDRLGGKIGVSSCDGLNVFTVRLPLTC